MKKDESSPGKDVRKLFAGANTREFGVDGFTFRVRKLSWGDKEDIRKECIVRQPTGKVDVDYKRLNIQTMLRCLDKAPFDIDEETIMKLDAAVGDRILVEIDALNTIGGDVAKNLGGPSEVKAE